MMNFFVNSHLQLQSVLICTYCNGHKNAKFNVENIENLVYGAKGST